MLLEVVSRGGPSVEHAEADGGWVATGRFTGGFDLFQTAVYGMSAANFVTPTWQASPMPRVAGSVAVSGRAPRAVAWRTPRPSSPVAHADLGAHAQARRRRAFSGRRTPQFCARSRALLV